LPQTSSTSLYSNVMPFEDLCIWPRKIHKVDVCYSYTFIFAPLIVGCGTNNWCEMISKCIIQVKIRCYGKWSYVAMLW
jgi:hypothetical protein